MLTLGDVAQASSDEIRAAEDSGWIIRVPSDPIEVLFREDSLTLGPDAVDLIQDGLAAVTGGEPDAWSHLIRICMGQIPVPAGCPLDLTLAGEWPTERIARRDLHEVLQEWRV